jgi:hypothetical protein
MHADQVGAMDVIADIRGKGSRAGSDSGEEASADHGNVKQQRHRAFHRPVIVQTGRIDRERVVRGTRDAAEMLLRHWPLSESRKRARAMEICLRVIRGEKPPSAARRAFVEAAREARVLIEE